MSNWFKPADVLPPERKYVIAKTTARWKDEDDPENVNVVIAKLINGISLKERSELDNSDPRKKTYRTEDEWGNNERPYNWETFGSTIFHGQNVIAWKFID